MSESSPSRGRGRPSVVDPMQISEVALELWQRDGYATTGWKEISEATGVSTRTLMRHFSTRAEIAWVGVIPAAQRMAAVADSIAPDLPLDRALRILIQASVTRDPKVFTLGPSWIRLVAEEPELAALSPTGHNPWIDAVASFIVARRPDVSDTVARAVAIAYQSATFAALTEWSRGSMSTDAADTVDRTLAQLGAVFTSP